MFVTFLVGAHHYHAPHLDRKTRRVNLSTMSEPKLLRYKRRIKDWEKQFLAKNGKLPSKNDVKADKEMWKAYKIYNQLKESDRHTNVTKEENAESVKEVNDQQEPEQSELGINAEFGPTPQANGKVLSMFDMIVSPPESSPLKTKSQGIISRQFSSPSKPLHPFASPEKPPMTDVFKTPTKAPRKLQFTDLTPSRGSPTKKSVLEQLQKASSPQKRSSNVTDAYETPKYLGKVNEMFLFREEDSDASPIKRNSYTTPVKSSLSPVAFNTTPSPLKPLRLLSFGSKKSLSDLFHECQNLEIDEEFEAQQQEIERELEASAKKEEDIDETEEIAPSRKRKRITQKRTTRRWKIKPRGENETEEFAGKDVHAEMQKIHEEDQREFLEYMDGDDADDVVTDDDETYVKPDLFKTSGKKKKTLSNNYQRLKINDPRTKRFKQRMRR